jgi:hypothetical protein
MYPDQYAMMMINNPRFGETLISKINRSLKERILRNASISGANMASVDIMMQTNPKPSKNRHKSVPRQPKGSTMAETP